MSEAAAGDDQMPAPVRIFVGGLGERVTDEELRSIFESKNLGRVEGVDIVRTKGRSFAYCNFLPSSAASLTKLISMYNGCAWKGGRLKLEKAKEHFLLRLRCEWEQDAALNSPSNDAVDADKVVELPEKRKKLVDPDSQIRLFFPRLRKVKSLPLKGTGKHKYSFQRFEALAHPKYFCDCEEHLGPSLPLREQRTSGPEQLSVGVDAEEFDLMRSVMNKLFEKETTSKVVHDESKLTGDKVLGGMNSDEPQQENIVEEDSDEDEEGLVINIVRKSGNTRSRTNKMENKILTPKRKRAELDRDENGRNSLKVQKTGNLSTERSVRSPPDENGVGEELPSFTTQGEKKPKAPSETRPKWSQKSSWKELLNDNTKGSFSVTNLLTGAGSSMKEDIERDKQEPGMPDSAESEDHESDEDSDGPDSDTVDSADSEESDEVTDAPNSDMLESADGEDHESDEDTAAPNSDMLESADGEDHEPDEDTDDPSSDRLESADGEGHESDKDTDAPYSDMLEPADGEDHESDEDTNAPNPGMLESADGEDDESGEDTDAPNSDMLESADVEDDESDEDTDAPDSVESADHELSKHSDVPESMDTEDDQSDKDSDAPNSVESEDHEFDKHSDVSDSMDTKDYRLVNRKSLGGQSEHFSESKGSMEVEFKESVAASSNNSNKSGRGSSWLHKSSWTQLLANNANQSFSLSRILSSDMNEAMEDHRDDTAVTDNKLNEDTPPKALVMGKEDVPSALSSVKVPENLISRTVGTTPGNSHQHEKGRARTGPISLGIGEECLFMRSSASLLDWANTKAALTGSRRRKKL